MSNESTPATTLKSLQSQRTRAALLRVARRVFAERGYAGTPLEDVAQKAGVTTGALYHQYADKRALFQAVLEQLQSERFEEIRRLSRDQAGAAGRRSWDRLVGAAELMLDCFLDPVFCRIVMVDGPAVLGWRTWHRIRAEQLLHPLELTLEQQMSANRIEREPVRPLARLLFGALSEAGMLIAHAEDQRAARKEAGTAAVRMFQRLKMPSRR